MKKLISFVFIFLAITNVKAQVNYTFNGGLAVGYPKALNNYLRNAGLPALRNTGISLGLDVKIQTQRFTTHVETNYLFYRSQEQNPFVTTQGFTFGNSIGYMVVNKYKVSLEPLIGLKYLNNFSLNIRNNTPTNNFATQLQTVHSTQINYRLGFLFHAGLQAKITVKRLPIILKMGHHIRLSKTNWYNNLPQQKMLDTPNFNPLGSYLTVGFSL